MLMGISSMSRKVSSYDVARIAGVSQTTVSLVLNGREAARIPESTRSRVREAAASLGYVVHSGARALATGRTNRIGIVPLEGPGNLGSYHYRLLEGVIASAREAEQHVLILSGTGPDPERLYSEVRGGAVDGVILVGRSDGDSLTQRLCTQGFPTVCVSNNPGIPGVPVVDIDHVMSGTLVANHFIERGHKRALFASWRANTNWCRKALSGFSRTFAKLGTDVVEIYGDGIEFDAYFRRISREIQRPLGATALYLLDGWTIDSLLSHLQAEDILVPQDVALVTGPDDPVCQARGLSAISEPVFEIGCAAANQLIAQFRGEDLEPSPLLQPSLQIRRSSALT